MSLICLTDPDAASATELARALGSAGHHVRTFETPRFTLSRGRQWRFDIYILVTPAVGMEIAEFQIRLNRQRPGVPLLLLEDHSQTVRRHRPGAISLRKKIPLEILLRVLMAMVASPGAV